MESNTEYFQAGVAGKLDFAVVEPLFDGQEQSGPLAHRMIVAHQHFKKTLWGQLPVEMIFHIFSFVGGRQIGPDKSYYLYNVRQVSKRFQVLVDDYKKIAFEKYVQDKPHFWYGRVGMLAAHGFARPRMMCDKEYRFYLDILNTLGDEDKGEALRESIHAYLKKSEDLLDEERSLLFRAKVFLVRRYNSSLLEGQVGEMISSVGDSVFKDEMRRAFAVEYASMGDFKQAQHNCNAIQQEHQRTAAYRACAVMFAKIGAFTWMWNCAQSGVDNHQYDVYYYSAIAFAKKGQYLPVYMCLGAIRDPDYNDLCRKQCAVEFAKQGEYRYVRNCVDRLIDFFNSGPCIARCALEFAKRGMEACSRECRENIFPVSLRNASRVECALVYARSERIPFMKICLKDIDDKSELKKAIKLCEAIVGSRFVGKRLKLKSCAGI